ncbi:MAG: hypothetical protein M1370_04470 [Bacteroidetes bacterium]|nr:hypothetical protein [Bacteroidota bacterium]MCL5027191.1 hypothetical protein [Chloroflexota bacterium]
MIIGPLVSLVTHGPSLLPLTRSWPVSLPAIDNIGAALLALSIAPAAVLVWGAVGSRRALDFYVLTLFYVIAAFLTMTVTNLVFFYFAWEILGLCCWGLGRWGTSLVGRPGIPANPAVILGSLCMFAALATLAWDSRSLDLVGLQTDSPQLVQRLLIAACFLRAWGILGHAWRAVEGRAFAVSQGILAGGAVVAVGVYPLARFYLVAVDWAVPWQPTAIWVGGLVGLVMMVAALGEVRIRPSNVGASAANETSAAAYRAMTYLAFGFFGWSVALMGLVGSPLEPGWLLWVGAGGLSIAGVFLAAELAGIDAAADDERNAGEGVALWPRLAGGAGFVVAGAALIGVPPVVGYSARLLTALRLFVPGQELLVLGFAASSLVTFFFLCRLAIVTSRIGGTKPVRWPVPLALALSLDLGALAWLSLSPFLPVQLLTAMLSAWGAGG